MIIVTIIAVHCFESDSNHVFSGHFLSNAAILKLYAAALINMRRMVSGFHSNRL